MTAATTEPRPTAPVADNLLAVAHAIARRLEPYAEMLDRDPSQLGYQYDTLRRHDYLRIPVPHELGGAGARLADIVALQRVLAASCANTALAVNMHLFQVGALADDWRRTGVATRLLQAVAERGCVVASTTGEAVTLHRFTTATTLTPTPDGYRLTGHKRFCSQARVMDLVRLIATDRATGALVMVVVPRPSPGLQVVESRPTMGMRGTQSFDLEFDHVELPADAVIHRFDGAVPLQDPAFARGLIWFLATIAGVYTGIADGASAELERNERMDSEVAAQRSRLDGLLAEGLRRLEDAPEPAALRVAVRLKHEVTVAARELVDACVERSGSVAYVSGTPLERAVRDVRAGRHHPPDPNTTRRLLRPAARAHATGGDRR